VRRTQWPAAALGLLAILLVLWGGAAGAATTRQADDQQVAPKDLKAALEDGDELPDTLSGAQDFARADYGTGLTQCPQAGLNDQALEQPTNDPLADTTKHSGNIRLNQDYSCFAQDETSVAINPTNSKNVISGANDYRNGFGSSGFYSTTDGGKSWYDGVKPFPSPDNGNDHLDGGGDPAIAYDRQGTAYYADIHFDRTDATNGVFVARSTNGGYTWSRPCVALNGNAPHPATDAGAVCGGPGDPRTPNDGTVQYFQDGPLTPTTDKEYIATGPRPAGAAPTCFQPVSKAPIAQGQPGCPTDVIGPDRVYVTWTLFDTAGCNTAANDTQHCSVQILEAYSDDRGHSFSSPHQVTGTAAFCSGIFGDNSCDDSQGSVPTVSQTDGTLYVSYENFNTADENQYLVSKSTDGGQTFTGPYFVSTVFDVNYPRSSGDPDPGAGNRPDCGARGQGDGRSVLTNSCFRVDSYGDMVVDKRGGAFANDLYLTFSDNRNGSMQSSNVDVFFFKSTDGGLTWTGPTRVNSDASRAPDVTTEGGRDCGRIVGRTCPSATPNFGNDNYFPWLDISKSGTLFVGWEDRRLDTSTTTTEWPTSRSRTGNYLVWFWGAKCDVNTPDSRDCVAAEATTPAQPTGAVNPASGAVPLGAAQASFPFRNMQLQDVPNNWDYTFRAGIFAGDYSGVAAGADQKAWAVWTDSRNGRSSRNELGRNPACEQSDIFAAIANLNGDNGQGNGNGQNDNGHSGDLNAFAVAQCPTAAVDDGSHGGNGDHKFHDSNHGKHGH
jgi:hypothetical protein